MGIKKFYLYLRKSYPWVFVKDHNKLKVECLAIDTNAIIHNVAKDVYNLNMKENKDIQDVYLNPEKYEDMTIKKVITTIEGLRNEYKPEYIIIALDGVPVMAKIAQQRKRRFPDDSRHFDQQPKPRYISQNGWSSSTVSVGTKFMDKVSKSIKKYLKALYKDEEIQYVYSSHRSPGEGEHKILKYLREYDFKDVLFYSPDSDILLLSMMLNTHIFVRSDVYIEKDGIMLTDVNKLKQAFNIHTNDFVLLSYLSGNDFIPCIPEFDNIDGSMPVLLQVYKKLGKRLTTDTDIDWGNFKMFLQMCMTFRSAFIYPKEERYKNITIKDKVDFSLFDFIHNKDKEDMNLNEMCKYYFQTLYWNLKYYIGEDIDTSYQYPYPFEFAPTLSVILDNFTEDSYNFEFKHFTYLKPIEALATIIPFTDFYLLPLEARKIAAELEDEYPLYNATIVYFDRIRDYWKKYKKMFEDMNEKEDDIDKIE